MLGDRNFKILKLLKEGINNIFDISNKLEISERMLRYDIEILNQIFKYYTNLEILEIKNANLTLLIHNYDEKLSLIPFKEYVFNTLEREIYITLDIFLENNKFKLQELSNKYSISKSTLRNVIKAINLEIDKYNIKIDIDSNKGYMLIGKETKIRFYLINKLRNLKKHDFNVYFLNILNEKIKKYSKGINFNESRKLIKNFVKDIKILDEAFEILSYYLYISINRNFENNKLIEDEIDNKNFIIKTEEYKKFMKYFINTNLNQLDIIMFTDIYLGIYTPNDEDIFYSNWLEIEDVVDDVINKLNLNFNKNFNLDKIFREEFIHHIKPAMYRMKKKILLSESICGEVKKEYEEIYEKTKKSLNGWDAEEISYVTIMVKRALDRMEKVAKKDLVKILIVCGLGYSSSRLIVDNLEENFDVDIVDVIPYNMLENYTKIDEIDLIVTTLDISSKKNEIIKVNAIFNSKDVEKLSKYGLPRKNIKISEKELLEFIKNNKDKNEEEIKENIRNKFKSWIYIDVENKKNKRIYDFLTKDNVKLNVKANSIDEALRISVNLMYKNNIVEKKYYNNLKEQINKYGKYIQIGDMTILPHGNLNEYVKKTGFSLITLENEIKFFGEGIRIIISLAVKDKTEHLDAILDINKCLRKYNFEKKLLDIKNENEIGNFLKNILEGEI